MGGSNCELKNFQLVLKWTLCLSAYFLLTSNLPVSKDYFSSPQTFYNVLNPVIIQSPECHNAWPSLQSHIFVWLRNVRHKLLRNVPLSYDRRSHQMTLLLISGLNPNPGPRHPKYPCGVCGYACKTGVIACDECNKWIHKECIGMSTSTLLRIGDSSDTWICPVCQSKNTSTQIYTLSDQNTTNSCANAATTHQSASHLPQTPTDPSALSSSLESSVAGTSVSPGSPRNQTVYSLSENESPLCTSSPKGPTSTSIKQLTAKAPPAYTEHQF